MISLFTLNRIMWIVDIRVGKKPAEIVIVPASVLN